MPAGANVTSPFVIAGQVPVGVGTLGRAPSLDGASTEAAVAASGLVSEPASESLADELHAATRTKTRDGVLIAGDQTRNRGCWLDRIGHAID
jgi:hypothetical protein